MPGTERIQFLFADCTCFSEISRQWIKRLKHDIFGSLASSCLQVQLLFCVTTKCSKTPKGKESYKKETNRERMK